MSIASPIFGEVRAHGNAWKTLRAIPGDAATGGFDVITSDIEKER
jgi:hypothetical protein